MAKEELDHENLISRLERLGETHVELVLGHDGFPFHVKESVREWLSKKKEARQTLSEASQSEQIAIARSAKDAAWAAAKAAERAATAAEAANRRATAAIIVATISIIVTAAIALYHSS